MNAVEIDKAIGAHLQKLRKQKGMTQVELGKIIGRTPTSVHYMESGHHSLKLHDLSKVAGVYGTTAWEILRELKV